MPYIKKIIIRYKIRRDIRKERYFLQYQPIYNPRDKIIVGFEALLRLKGKNKEIIKPYAFIQKIEKNNMLPEISLWIINKIVEDYKKLETFSCVKENKFYVSFNVSLKEVENDYFIQKAIEILQKANLLKSTICIEIIERVKISDVGKLTQNITRLKNAGFKIAIDDFGIEYSNLDILNKVDFDTIKVDKNFIDGIDDDIIKREIIFFISRIAMFKNKEMVLEGVEKFNQDLRIREIKNPLLYAQGYYYNKPMNIDELRNV